MLSVLGMGCIGMFCVVVVAMADDPPEKVELCHVPPGDTSAAHTITVSVKAADSHLAKHAGDSLGACPSSCETEDACDDGNMCTSDDCVNGLCVNEVVDCDDGNSCTSDSCDPAIGCENADLAVGTPCDLDNPCLTSECFSDGVCGGVSTQPDGAACDDGEECTTDDRCVVVAGTEAFCTGFVTECDCFDYRVGGYQGQPLCNRGNPCTATSSCKLEVLECGAGLLTCFCGACDPDLGCVGACSSDADCDGGDTCMSGCCDSGPF